MANRLKPQKRFADFTDFNGNLEPKGNMVKPLGAVLVGGPCLEFTYKFCIFLKIMKESIKLYPASLPAVLRPRPALGQ